jgi:hypothetical protein
MTKYAEFDKAYSKGPDTIDMIPCDAPSCFIGSYAPVAKAGEEGPFYVNTYLLQPDRRMETLGTATVRSSDLSCKK